MAAEARRAREQAQQEQQLARETRRAVEVAALRQEAELAARRELTPVGYPTAVAVAIPVRRRSSGSSPTTRVGSGGGGGGGGRIGTSPPAGRRAGERSPAKGHVYERVERGKCVNPGTGKEIKIGGPTYTKLIERGFQLDAESSLMIMG